MFGFRRKIEGKTEFQEHALLSVIHENIDDAVGTLAEHLRREMQSLRSLVHEAQEQTVEVKKEFESFEQTIHAEVRTLCQNAAEATRACADAMEILRPTLMKIREQNLPERGAER